MKRYFLKINCISQQPLKDLFKGSMSRRPSKSEAKQGVKLHEARLIKINLKFTEIEWSIHVVSRMRAIDCYLTNDIWHGLSPDWFDWIHVCWFCLNSNFESEFELGLNWGFPMTKFSISHWLRAMSSNRMNWWVNWAVPVGEGFFLASSGKMFSDVWWRWWGVKNVVSRRATKRPNGSFIWKLNIHPVGK